MKNEKTILQQMQTSIFQEFNKNIFSYHIVMISVYIKMILNIKDKIKNEKHFIDPLSVHVFPSI